jgi:DNA-binding CsgD family transcriptional regulator
MIKGWKAFRAMFRGELWMEVFLVVGMNASLSDIIKIAALGQEIRPDRIHLNTAVRPPAEEFAVPLGRERLNSLVRLFRPTAEVIAEFKPKQMIEARITQDEILSLLKRRPCTAQQIAESYGMHLNEVAKYLGNLMREKRLDTRRCDSSLYYTALSGEEGTACPQIAENFKKAVGPNGPEKNGAKDSKG